MESKLTVAAAVSGICGAVIMLCVVLYGQAQINQQVGDLKAAEARIEAKVDDMSQKVDWLYGYHRINGHHENLTRMVETPAPVAMPRSVAPLGD